MALDKDTLEEIKSYMDTRGDAWRMEARSAAETAIADRTKTSDEKNSRRWQLASAIGGVSIITLLGGTYEITRQAALSVAGTETKRVIDEDKEYQDYIKKSLETIVDARVRAGTALEQAEEILKDAKKVLESAEASKDELTERIEEAGDQAATIGSQLNSLQEQAKSVDNSRLQVEKILGDAQITRTRLDTLSENVKNAEELSERLIGAGGQIDSIIVSTLKDPEIRQQIVSAAAFPSQAVVAFGPSGIGQPICPVGWSLFSKADGKFILGAEEKIYPVGSEGGSTKVVLTEAQMPSHSHEYKDIFFSQTKSNKNFNYTKGHGDFANVPQSIGLGIKESVDKDNVGYQFSRESFGSGSGQPHSNMPPYIALYFCKKS